MSRNRIKGCAYERVLPPMSERLDFAKHLMTKENVDELERIMKCAICSKLIKNIKVTKCGHGFCGPCIDGHLRKEYSFLQRGEFSKLCPLCFEKIGSKRELKEDPEFDSLIKEWVFASETSLNAGAVVGDDKVYEIHFTLKPHPLQLRESEAPEEILERNVTTELGVTVRHVCRYVAMRVQIEKKEPNEEPLVKRLKRLQLEGEEEYELYYLDFRSKECKLLPDYNLVLCYDYDYVSLYYLKRKHRGKFQFSSCS